MPDVPPDEPLVYCSLRWLRDFRETNCILYYLPGDAPATQEVMESIADLVDTKFRAAIRAVINPEITWLGVRARYLSPASDIEAYSSEASAAGLHVSGDTEPEEVAVVIQKRTHAPGRDARGRCFFPHVPSDALDGSAIITVERAKYLTIANHMEDTLLSAETPDLQPIHWSRKTGTVHPITECRVDGEVKSRRDRREPRRSVLYSS